MDLLASMGTPSHLLRCIKACITTPMFSVAVNGELAGFFASGRGLIQGDPLSPFLFIIAMEAFSRSLSLAVGRPGFEFHPKCKEVNLSRLCFADDIFLFSKGNASSVQVFMDELSNFESLSGLQVNRRKSAALMAGVSENVKNDILNTTGFAMGRLPLKYLGVPLISTRLTHSDCQPLIDKILLRIQAWTSRSLSYAGRLQLISSVLYSIQTYWCSMFIIPKFTCAKIEQMFNRFLWSGTVDNARRAKVSWKSICIPREEGGLGLRRVKHWNDAAVMKHIWKLFYRKDSIWVAWVRTVLLKGGSIWSTKTPSRCSWSWRKILQFRHRMRLFIRHRVFRGNGTFLWHDFWNPMGPLLSVFGETIVYDSAIQRDALVASVLDSSRWNWLVANSADLITIKNSCADIVPDDSRDDIISWTQTQSGIFTVSSAWNTFRPRSSKVEWYSAVWFNQAIRRHSFVVWLGVHDRLSTQDKLLKWGLLNSTSCVFCSRNIEDHNHLFFECTFPANIWKRVLMLCGESRMPRTWDNEFLWVIGCKGKSLCSITKRIAWGAVIYHVWRQRNARIYEKEFTNADTIFNIICNDVRLRITSLRNFPNIPANLSMCERWHFNPGILGSLVNHT